ncbi:MAG: DNA internalization-related competence protein ComEC/Rec2, partial [Syntrophobacteraceae bacterium]|nr:DNA internalization-related competence protein ComEC/Rec2 [Syntrophobacteraceae bacterium]
MPPDSRLGDSFPRPIFMLTAAFVLGIAATRLLPEKSPEYLFFLLSAPLLLVHAIAALLHAPTLRLSGVTLTLFLFLGFTAGLTARPFSPGHPLLDPFLDGRETLCIAKVTQPPDYTPDRIRLPLFLYSAIVEGQAVPLKASVLASIGRDQLSPGDLVSGDWVMARLRLKRFRGFANPGGFDYGRYQAEQGFYGRAFLPDSRSLVKISGTPFEPSRSTLSHLRGGTDRFRQEALAWLENTLPPDAASFYAALLLGYQRLISQEWFDDRARAGVTHLLSIGGLHLGLVSLFVFWLFRGFLRLFLPGILRRWTDQHLALWPALLTAALYAGVAGFSSPPIWRSMLMLAICLMAAHWYRNPDSLSVLALAALAILAMDPNALWQISFQLTFVCMFAIFTLYPTLDRFRVSRLHPALEHGRWTGKLLRPFEEAFWVSLAVSVMVVPLTVYYFYGVSLAGLIANIILVPFVGFLVLPPGLAGVALFAIHENLGYPALQLGAWFLELAQSVILWFSGLSWSYVWVGKPSLFALVVCYTFLGVFLQPWPWRRKALAALGLSLLVTGQTVAGSLLAAQGKGGDLRIHVMDVGQGASTLVRFPSGEDVLIDGGGFVDESFDMGRAVIAPFLWHVGIRRLDHVILSHDHPDHAG